MCRAGHASTERFSIHQPAESRGTRQMQRGWYLGEAAPKPIQTGPEGVPRLRIDKLVPLGWRITPLMVEPCGHGTKDLHKSLG